MAAQPLKRIPNLTASDHTTNTSTQRHHRLLRELLNTLLTGPAASTPAPLQSIICQQPESSTKKATGCYSLAFDSPRASHENITTVYVRPYAIWPLLIPPTAVSAAPLTSTPCSLPSSHTGLSVPPCTFHGCSHLRFCICSSLWLEFLFANFHFHFASFLPSFKCHSFKCHWSSLKFFLNTRPPGNLHPLIFL